MRATDYRGNMERKSFIVLSTWIFFHFKAIFQFYICLMVWLIVFSFGFQPIIMDTWMPYIFHTEWNTTMFCGCKKKVHRIVISQYSVSSSEWKKNEPSICAQYSGWCLWLEIHSHSEYMRFLSRGTKCWMSMLLMRCGWSKKWGVYFFPIFVSFIVNKYIVYIDRCKR